MRKRTDQDQQVNLSEEVSEKEKRFGNMTRKYYQNEDEIQDSIKRK